MLDEGPIFHGFDAAFSKLLWPLVIIIINFIFSNVIIADSKLHCYACTRQFDTARWANCAFKPPQIKVSTFDAKHESISIQN